MPFYKLRKLYLSLKENKLEIMQLIIDKLMKFLYKIRIFKVPLFILTFIFMMFNLILFLIVFLLFCYFYFSTFFFLSMKNGISFFLICFILVNFCLVVFFFPDKVDFINNIFFFSNYSLNEIIKFRRLFFFMASISSSYFFFKPKKIHSKINKKLRGCPQKKGVCEKIRLGYVTKSNFATQNLNTRLILVRHFCDDRSSSFFFYKPKLFRKIFNGNSKLTSFFSSRNNKKQSLLFKYALFNKKRLRKSSRYLLKKFSRDNEYLNNISPTISDFSTELKNDQFSFLKESFLYYEIYSLAALPLSWSLHITLFSFSFLFFFSITNPLSTNFAFEKLGLKPEMFENLKSNYYFFFLESLEPLFNYHLTLWNQPTKKKLPKMFKSPYAEIPNISRGIDSKNARTFFLSAPFPIFEIPSNYETLRKLNDSDFSNENRILVEPYTYHFFPNQDPILYTKDYLNLFEKNDQIEIQSFLERRSSLAVIQDSFYKNLLSFPYLNILFGLTSSIFEPTKIPDTYNYYILLNIFRNFLISQKFLTFNYLSFQYTIASNLDDRITEFVNLWHLIYPINSMQVRSFKFFFKFFLFFLISNLPKLYNFSFHDWQAHFLIFLQEFCNYSSVEIPTENEYYRSLSTLVNSFSFNKTNFFFFKNSLFSVPIRSSLNLSSPLSSHFFLFSWYSTFLHSFIYPKFRRISFSNLYSDFALSDSTLDFCSSKLNFFKDFTSFFPFSNRTSNFFCKLSPSANENHSLKLSPAFISFLSLHNFSFFFINDSTFRFCNLCISNIFFDFCNNNAFFFKLNTHEIISFFEKKLCINCAKKLSLYFQFGSNFSFSNISEIISSIFLLNKFTKLNNPNNKWFPRIYRSRLGDYLLPNEFDEVSDRYSVFFGDPDDNIDEACELRPSFETFLTPLDATYNALVDYLFFVKPFYNYFFSNIYNHIFRKNRSVNLWQYYPKYESFNLFDYLDSYYMNEILLPIPGYQKVRENHYMEDLLPTYFNDVNLFRPIFLTSPIFWNSDLFSNVRINKPKSYPLISNFKDSSKKFKINTILPLNFVDNFNVAFTLFNLQTLSRPQKWKRMNKISLTDSDFSPDSFASEIAGSASTIFEDYLNKLGLPDEMKPDQFEYATATNSMADMHWAQFLFFKNAYFSHLPIIHSAFNFKVNKHFRRRFVLDSKFNFFPFKNFIYQTKQSALNKKSKHFLLKKNKYRSFKSKIYKFSPKIFYLSKSIVRDFFRKKHYKILVYTPDRFLSRDLHMAVLFDFLSKRRSKLKFRRHYYLRRQSLRRLRRSPLALKLKHQKKITRLINNTNIYLIYDLEKVFSRVKKSFLNLFDIKKEVPFFKLQLKNEFFKFHVKKKKKRSFSAILSDTLLDILLTIPRYFMKKKTTRKLTENEYVLKFLIKKKNLKRKNRFITQLSRVNRKKKRKVFFKKLQRSLDIFKKKNLSNFPSETHKVKKLLKMNPSQNLQHFSGNFLTIFPKFLKKKSSQNNLKKKALSKKQFYSKINLSQTHRITNNYIFDLPCEILVNFGRMVGIYGMDLLTFTKEPREFLFVKNSLRQFKNPQNFDASLLFSNNKNSNLFDYYLNSSSLRYLDYIFRPKYSKKNKYLLFNEQHGTPRPFTAWFLGHHAVLPIPGYLSTALYGKPNNFLSKFEKKRKIIRGSEFDFSKKNRAYAMGFYSDSNLKTFLDEGKRHFHPSWSLENDYADLIRSAEAAFFPSSVFTEIQNQYSALKFNQIYTLHQILLANQKNSNLPHYFFNDFFSNILPIDFTLNSIKVLEDNIQKSLDLSKYHYLANSSVISLINKYSFLNRKLSSPILTETKRSFDKTPLSHGFSSSADNKSVLSKNHYLLHNLINYLSTDFQYLSFHQWASDLNRLLLGYSFLNSSSPDSVYNSSAINSSSNLLFPDLEYLEEIFKYRTKFSALADSFFAKYVQEFAFINTKLSREFFSFCKLSLQHFLLELNFEFYFLFCLFKEFYISEQLLSSWIHTVNSYLNLKYQTSLLDLSYFFQALPALQVCSHLYSLILFTEESNSKAFIHPQFLSSFSKYPENFNILHYNSIENSYLKEKKKFLNPTHRIDLGSVTFPYNHEYKESYMLIDKKTFFDSIPKPVRRRNLKILPKFYKKYHSALSDDFRTIWGIKPSTSMVSARTPQIFFLKYTKPTFELSSSTFNGKDLFWEKIRLLEFWEYYNNILNNTSLDFFFHNSSENITKYGINEILQSNKNFFSLSLFETFSFSFFNHTYMEQIYASFKNFAFQNFSQILNEGLYLKRISNFFTLPLISIFTRQFDNWNSQKLNFDSKYFFMSYFSTDKIFNFLLQNLVFDGPQNFWYQSFDEKTEIPHIWRLSAIFTNEFWWVSWGFQEFKNFFSFFVYFNLNFSFLYLTFETFFFFITLFFVDFFFFILFFSCALILFSTFSLFFNFIKYYFSKKFPKLSFFSFFPKKINMFNFVNTFKSNFSMRFNKLLINFLNFLPYLNMYFLIIFSNIKHTITIFFYWIQDFFR